MDVVGLESKNEIDELINLPRPFVCSQTIIILEKSPGRQTLSTRAHPSPFLTHDAPPFLPPLVPPARPPDLAFPRPSRRQPVVTFLFVGAEISDSSSVRDGQEYIGIQTRDEGLL